jgi:hypothetical protein
MCVCMWIHKLTLKIFYENNINVREKVTFKTINDKKVGLISLNPKPNVSPFYLKHILHKSLD